MGKENKHVISSDIFNFFNSAPPYQNQSEYERCNHQYLLQHYTINITTNKSTV